MASCQGSCPDEILDCQGQSFLSCKPLSVLICLYIASVESFLTSSSFSFFSFSYNKFPDFYFQPTKGPSFRTAWRSWVFQGTPTTRTSRPSPDLGKLLLIFSHYHHHHLISTMLGWIVFIIFVVVSRTTKIYLFCFYIGIHLFLGYNDDVPKKKNCYRSRKRFHLALTAERGASRRY